jgi:hypothetical protein
MSLIAHQERCPVCGEWDVRVFTLDGYDYDSEYWRGFKCDPCNEPFLVPREASNDWFVQVGFRA